ncbi:MAG: DUF2452 domain-containing protein [Gilvibacter sp.]
MGTKKPDNVVFDQDEQRYDAGLKSYATNVGAPAITTTDTVAWKQRNLKAANSEFAAKYQEIDSAYKELLKKYERNALVYSARFNFEPIVGQVYHLYKDNQAQAFLSIIAPEECNFDYVDSFRLGSDKLWELV